MKTIHNRTYLVAKKVQLLKDQIAEITQDYKLDSQSDKPSNEDVRTTLVHLGYSIIYESFQYLIVEGTLKSGDTRLLKSMGFTVIKERSHPMSEEFNTVIDW